MKMILAILSAEDSSAVSEALSKAGYASTVTPSRGGFLNAARDILFIGVDDMRVTDVLRVIGDNAHKREHTVPETAQPGLATPATVNTDGAVVFVLEVDRFTRL